MAAHRLIIDGPAAGAWNMAVDEVLLADAATNGTATLRFYQWSEPTLSLGYFQAHRDRDKHAASRNCPLVRRQTGGGAILHDMELTYSVALPVSHPMAKETKRLYDSIHDAVIAELLPRLGTTSSWKLVRHDQESSMRPGVEPFLCFQRRTAGDVVLRSSAASGDNAPPADAATDWKLLGSAQRRYRGAVLQHGSLLLNRSSSAPELAGWFDLTSVPVTLDHVANSLGERISAVLGVELGETGLPASLKSKALDLANTKYGAAGWTNRR